MRQMRLRFAQRPLDPLPLRHVDYKGDALVLAVAERRRAEESRHAAAVFAKVLFLTRLDGSSGLQLCSGLVVGVVPFGRCQLPPAEPTRDQIFACISDN